MAYLKTNYRAEFYCAILNNSIKDKSKSSLLLNDFKRRNGKVNNPNIRALTSKYVVTNNAIQMPLTTINGVTSSLVASLKEVLVDKKELLNNKDNLFLVLKTIYYSFGTKDIFTNMIKAGAFD